MDKLFKWSLDNQKFIEMIYQSNNGKFTQRCIKVADINDTHIRAYCSYRKNQRLFKKDNILSVAMIQGKNRRGA